MDKNIFRYILRHSAREQAVILLIVLASFIFYFLSLDIPKVIVNQAIQGGAFPTPGSTAPFLRTVVGIPGFLGGGDLVVFPGIPLERVPYLFGLSLLFLALVVVNNGFKFVINMMKGRMGERLLRRLRYDLFDRIMRFPLPHFRKVKSAEAATMIKDEVEPLGGFIGDAFITPVFLAGQAITAMIFIMVQNLWLGIVAMCVVGVQFTIIPRLRRRIIKLGRERQITARRLAGRIAETVDGVREIHANDTTAFERTSIGHQLGRIFAIRFEIYQRKFFAKLLNNFFAQVTPFIFYAGGGYLAIMGRLDIGALVAVIAAYKDLPSPLKELLDWDQQRIDVQVKYEQVVEQFRVDKLVEPEMQAPSEAAPPRLQGHLKLSNVSYTDEAGTRRLDAVSFAVEPGQKVAVVGQGAAGTRELALVVSRLLLPSGGGVEAAGIDLIRAPESVTGRRIAYVGPDCFLWPLSVRENLLYALKSRPAPLAGGDPARARWLMEARRTGNPLFDIDGDWISYESAGLAGPEALAGRLGEVVQETGLAEDAYEWGLGMILDPALHPRLVEGVLEARRAMAVRLREPDFAELVEPFAGDRFNRNMSLAANLAFGPPAVEAFRPEALAVDPDLRRALESTGLTDELLRLAHEAVSTIVEILGELKAGHEMFEQFDILPAAELDDWRALLARADAAGEPARMGEVDRSRLLVFALRLVPVRHRVGSFDEAFQARVVAARKAYHETLPAERMEALPIFREDRYSAFASVQDNILFGTVNHDRAGALSQVKAAVGEVLATKGQKDEVTAAGLDFQVGVGGSRLSAAQRQRISLARAFLKRPDIFVLDDATGGMDGGAQRRLAEAVFREAEGSIVLWFLSNPAQARSFDRILVMREGRIVETGTAAELERDGTTFHALLEAA